ncbi:uncharacterized protein [Mytilus edulis]|uniref:uncharacterized protein n=1 Tax=Mytilus edulis TaxID=6550 RepID=UPI0039EFD3FD
MASKDNTDNKRLLELVKAKNSKEVLGLLKQNVDIGYIDETGCTVLHYAASNGLVDVITVIGELDKNKTEVFNAKNREGETAVFYAVKHNQLQVLPALVAFGADFNIQDNNNKSPLSLAVDKKLIDICKFLCDIGAEVDITEWGLALMNINMLRGQDRTILELVKEHNTKMKARSYGLIKQKLIHVGKDYDKKILSDLGAEVEFSTYTNSFYFFISKISPDYSPVSKYLENKQRIFSDIYSTKCWGNAKMSTQMKLMVPGHTRGNERISVVPVERKQKVQLTNVKSSEDIQNPITELLVSQTYGKDEAVQFVTIATILPEIFKVPKSGTTIEPKIEPGCCIQIPEGTFASEKLLSVNVAETLDWKFEESENTDVLYTNVLKVVVAGGTQPKTPVTLKLPLHSKSVKVADIVIMSSSQAIPQTNNDWEVVETTKARIENGKIVFEVCHFSWYVAGSSRKKSIISKGFSQATKAVNGERKLEIYVMVKQESDGSFQLVIEWAIQIKAKERRKYWKTKRQFDEQCSKTLDIQNNRTYKMTFSQDLLVDDVMLNENQMDMYFDQRKEFSLKMFTLVATDELPRGYIFIEKQVTPKQENDFEPRIENVDSNWMKNIKKPPQFEFERCLTLPVGMEGAPVGKGSTSIGIEDSSVSTEGAQCVILDNEKDGKAAIQDKSAAESEYEPTRRDRGEIKYKKFKVKVDPDDPQCTIQVLRKGSLRRIGDLLTDEECYKLGAILRIEKKVLDKLKGKENIQHKIFEEWRYKHTLPNASLVEVLAEALEKIGRISEAEIVWRAHADKSEFSYSVD